MENTIQPSYYNEFDAYPAQWLRNLIDAEHIKAGVVDTRSIVDVRSDDLRPYDRCHFFAGISGWGRALRIAGIPDDFPVWTGSCSCQPFSNAGKRKAHDDDRDLWPHFRRLIAERRPSVVFGEQVASRLGREWLSGVRADLEDLGYAVGAADLCAAGAGAPHIRQRLYWGATTRRLADADGAGRQPQQDVAGSQPAGDAAGKPRVERLLSSDRTTKRLGDTDDAGLQERVSVGGIQRQTLGAQSGQAAVGGGDASGLANSCAPGRRALQRTSAEDGRPKVESDGHSNAFWSDYDVVHCTDGKSRRFEPGSFPLAYGSPSRVGRLRAYGNTIVPQVAATFIREFLSLVEWYPGERPVLH